VGPIAIIVLPVSLSTVLNDSSEPVESHGTRIFLKVDEFLNEVKVEVHQKRPEKILMSEDGRRLYVGNLDKNCHKDEVEELFVRFGKIESLWLAKQPSGFGFVVCCMITAF
jgi:RNA recognition motif-containing protein